MSRRGRPGPVQDRAAGRRRAAALRVAMNDPNPTVRAHAATAVERRAGIVLIVVAGCRLSLRERTDSDQVDGDSAGAGRTFRGAKGDSAAKSRGGCGIDRASAILHRPAPESSQLRP